MDHFFGMPGFGHTLSQPLQWITLVCDVLNSLYQRPSQSLQWITLVRIVVVEPSLPRWFRFSLLEAQPTDTLDHFGTPGLGPAWLPARFLAIFPQVTSHCRYKLLL